MGVDRCVCGGNRDSVNLGPLLGCCCVHLGKDTDVDSFDDVCKSVQILFVVLAIFNIFSIIIYVVFLKTEIPSIDA